MDQRGERSSRQHEARHIEPRTRFCGMLRHEPQHEEHAEEPERDVDEEDPAPRRVGGDESAERRPDHRRDQSRPDDEADRIDDPVLRRFPQHDQAADRRHECRSGALQQARSDESRERRSQAAEKRCQREHGDGRGEEVACAEPVARPAGGRDEHGHGDEIDGDAGGEVERGFAEAPAMAGSAVVTIVLSSVSMKNAAATMSGSGATWCRARHRGARGVPLDLSTGRAPAGKLENESGREAAPGAGGARQLSPHVRGGSRRIRR